ncbi:hypothetical protein [Streptomyces rochei]|uniref:hypothetical protein n=1 Tax=Streptomyces rochei TaxID=1928 RepID=UPI0036860175
MTATHNGYVTVVWDAKAKAGREDDLKAFITAAVTMVSDRPPARRRADQTRWLADRR